MTQDNEIPKKIEDASSLYTRFPLYRGVILKYMYLHDIMDSQKPSLLFIIFPYFLSALVSHQMVTLYWTCSRTRHKWLSENAVAHSNGPDTEILQGPGYHDCQQIGLLALASEKFPR